MGMSNKEDVKTWLTSPMGLVGLNGVTEAFKDTKFSEKGKLFLDLYLNKEAELVKVFLAELRKAHKDNLKYQSSHGSTGDKDLPVELEIKAGKHPKFIKDPSLFVKLRFTSSAEYPPKLFDGEGDLIQNVVNRIPYGTAATVNFAAAPHNDMNAGNKGGTSLYMSNITIAKMPDGSSLTERRIAKVEESDFASSGVDIDLI